jgi:transposase
MKKINFFIMQKPKFKKEIQECMKMLLKEAKTSSETRRIQCVLFGALGMSSPAAGLLTGFHPQYVRSVWSEYRKNGESALLGESRGRHRARAYITLEKENQFLSPFLKKAEKGGLLFISDVHSAYNELIGRKTPESTVYRMLHRHGWRKIMPRPYHPKGNPEKQEKFKDFFPVSHKKG